MRRLLGLLPVLFALALAACGATPQVPPITPQSAGSETAVVFVDAGSGLEPNGTGYAAKLNTGEVVICSVYHVIAVLGARDLQFDFTSVQYTFADTDQPYWMGPEQARDATICWKLKQEVIATKGLPFKVYNFDQRAPKVGEVVSILAHQTTVREVESTADYPQGEARADRVPQLIPGTSGAPVIDANGSAIASYSGNLLARNNETGEIVWERDFWVPTAPIQ